MDQLILYNRGEKLVTQPMKLGREGKGRGKKKISKKTRRKKS